jgi:HD-GYP domain-containing protein (c-di-GMP phosphodiesterase class II)
MNEEIARMLTKVGRETAHRTMNFLSDVSQKMIDEIYTVGLQPALVDECKALQNNMHELIGRDEALKEILISYTDMESSSHTHLFLVSFFSSVICKNLDWVGPRTQETIALGAFLHDIGLLKLPPSLRTMPPEKMTEKQLALFRTHPKLGAEMLMDVPTVNEQVRQIIFQHHECVDGSGFPNHLSGTKIYPLAKIVALADYFSYLLIKNRFTPIQGVKEFLQDRDALLKFDPLILKALVRGFSSNKGA